MRKPRTWRRLSAATPAPRRASRRSTPCITEQLERRDILSTFAGSAPLGTTGQVGSISPGGVALSGATGTMSTASGGGTQTSSPYTYESLKAQMEAWEDQYGPRTRDLVTLERIGDAVENYNPKNDPGFDPSDPRDLESHRGLWALKISDHAS